MPLDVVFLFATRCCLSVCQEGKLPSQCLKEGHCKALQTTFFECKRSMVCPNVFVVVLELKFKNFVEVKTVTQGFFFLFFSSKSWTQDQDSEEGKATKGL